MNLFSRLMHKALPRRPYRFAPLPDTERGRRWRLAQVETSMACNIACSMCPWHTVRKILSDSGLMERAVWEALLPHLEQIDSVDLSGGGEPLLHPELPERIAQAKAAGCTTGFLTNGTLLDENMAARILEAGADWLGVSMDGATAETYEHIRKGASFEKVCANIRTLTALRDRAKAPYLIIQTVLLPQNIEEIADMVRLAADLGADHLTFKQCDVIRGEHGKGLGVFATGKSEQDKAVKKVSTALEKATRLGRRLGLEVEHFGVKPDELPICGHDPRTSFFLASDGRVCPCINLAYGGDSTFLGAPVTLPTVEYGRLPESNFAQIWEESKRRQNISNRFSAREAAYSKALSDISHRELDLPHLRQGLNHARRCMPPAPKGCNVCHYLYGV